jgi:arylsulfatase A-like enzyme
MVVLDTVRADRTSLCGYGKPTTPVLEGLAADGAAHTCKAIAPGSWTLPSHASFFTGKDTLAHRSHSITSGIRSFEGTSARSRTLKKDYETLAETLSAQGYQTVLASANPVVNRGMGLAQGFQHTETASGFGDMHGEKLLPRLQKSLEGVDRDEPLFLFLNIADAHRPWQAVPEGLEWVDEQPTVRFSKNDDEGIWQRYIEGSTTAEQDAALLPRLSDVYDYAVYQADLNLGRSLGWLSASGWIAEDTRIVITSDHGEFLGEHRLLDHGHYVYDGNVKVPFLSINGPGSLPDRLSGLHAYDIARTGALPADLSPSRTAAWPHARRCARTDGKGYCELWAAIWTEDAKLVWRDGEVFQTALDSLEEKLEPLGEHPRRPELEAYGEAVAEDAVDIEAEELEKDVLEMLRAAGYLD